MSTTTFDDTTVEIEFDGQRTGPVPISALDEAAKRLRGEQLSFAVGLPGSGDKPDFASVKITGDLTLDHDLKRRQHVVVTVTTPDGEVITQANGQVVAIGFKDKTDKYGTTTERVHTVSLS